MSKKKSPQPPKKDPTPKKNEPQVSLQSALLQNPIGFLKQNWIKVAALFALTFVIYYASFDYGYVLDDTIVIEENNYTKKGFAGIADILTSESMEGYFGKQMNLVQGNRYRPLSLVTFAMEYGIIGDLSPGLSHFINVLLYGLTGFLLLYVFQFLFANSPAWKTGLNETEKSLLAFATALVFIAHPLHVEAVANIKGRDEIMAVLFSVWALYFAYKDALVPKRKYLLIASVLYLLGLLSKENTITFLAIIPMTIWFFYGRGVWRSIPYLVGTTVLYLIWRFSVSGVPNLGAEITDIMNNPFLNMNGGEKLATIMFTLGKYIWLLIFPHPLTHDYYPYAVEIMTFASPVALASLVLYLALAFWGFRQWRKKLLPGYAIWFYLVTLTIVSNLVINLGTFMNDRFVYMPSLGFCLLLIYGILSLYKLVMKKGSQAVLYGMVCLPVLLYGVRSFVRVPAWENALTLNKAAFPASEGSARANSFMATALFEEARAITDDSKKLVLLQEARPYAQKAHAILPDYRNGNVMLAGVAGEIYRINRDLGQLLEDFYQVAINRPDIQNKTNASGQPTSFLTEYLEYVNQREGSNPALLAFYKKTLKAMSESRTPIVISWGKYMARTARQIAPNDPELVNLETSLRNR